jgi:hypothetical protein
MTPKQRAAANRKRLRKLAPVVLPRTRARDASQDARMKQLIAVPKAKRTKQEARELSNLMAIWIMREIR